MLEILLRLAPALLRHLAAYGELLSEEGRDALRVFRRQLLGLAIAWAAAVVAALMACVCVIAAIWDGPHRVNAIGALSAGFALLALAGAWYANSGVPRGQARPFQRLQAEWREDLRQFAALYPSLAGVERAASQTRQIHGD